MKKLFTLMALVWAFAHVAFAADLYLTIDDVSRVLVYLNDAPVTGLHDGRQSIAAEAYDRITFEAAPGCKLVSVVEREEGYDDYERTIYDNRCEIQWYYTSVEYVVTSASAGDVRTAKASVWVDTPSKVVLARGDGEERIELNAGTNEVAFDPTSEKRFSVSPADFDRPLYKVTHNGTDVTAEGIVRIDMADGDYLHIEADYPDKDYKVTLSVDGDYPDDRFVQGIYADNTFIDPAAAEEGSAKAQAGTRLTIKADTRQWEVLSFTVNGASEYFSDNWSKLVTGDIDVKFSVRKYSTLRVNVNVDDPEHVKVYRGQHYNGDLAEVGADGKVAVDVRRDTPIVSFVPDEGYHFTAVTVDDYEYPESEIKALFLQVGSLEEGETITVKSAAYNRDLPATIVVNGGEKAEGNFKLTRADGSEIATVPGRNEILLDPWDNPFTFDCRGPVEPFVYLNGREVEPTYPASQVYSLSLDDGDLAEVYFGERPAGLTGIEADSEAAGTELYNLQGIRVTSANPPAGVYVRSDGTKVLID